ncbi:MAG: CBS domain-containing protein [Patescibacteria group bacterium]|nr:CBS domain-containing protein [Patescibacteria group bacterium]
MSVPNRSVPGIRSRHPAQASLRLRRKVRGAVSIEYAGILAFIVATGVAAHLLVGLRADRLFDQTAQQIGLATGAPSAHASPGRDGARRGSDTTRESQPTTSNQLAYSVEWLALWTALAVGMLAIGLATRLIWRRVHARSPIAQDGADLASPELLERLFAKRQQIRRLLLRSLGSDSMFEAQAHQLMSTDIACVTVATSCAEVARIMAERQIRHMLVCRHNGTLLGIISDRDIRHRQGIAARDVMTADPITITPQSPVAPAVTQMISLGISCLPVLTPGGKVCGILTTTDLLLSLQCSLQVFEGIAAGFRQPQHAPRQRVTAAEPPPALVGAP